MRQVYTGRVWVGNSSILRNDRILHLQLGLELRKCQRLVYKGKLKKRL